MLKHTWCRWHWASLCWCPRRWPACTARTPPSAPRRWASCWPGSWWRRRPPGTAGPCCCSERSLCWPVRGLECGTRISCHQSPASPCYNLQPHTQTPATLPCLPTWPCIHCIVNCHPGIQAITISITKTKIWFLIHLWEGGERYSSPTHEFN